MRTRILIITKTEEMKTQVIEYLDKEIDPNVIRYRDTHNFKIGTESANEYRVWCNPNECTMCGVSVDLIYLDDSLPLSCLEQFLTLVNFNILNIRLIDKPEKIRVKVEDWKWI